MSLIKEFCQSQEISCSEIVRMLPLFVVVGTADGDGVERPFLALVFPNGYLQARHSEGFYGLWFVICHVSFSFRVKLNFGPAPETEDEVNETKGNDDRVSRGDGQPSK